MCSKMQRNFERYAGEVVNNKRNLEYWLMHGVRIQELSESATHNLTIMGKSFEFTNEVVGRSVGVFANDHSHACREEELIALFPHADWDMMRNQLNRGVQSSAYRACLMANFLRKRGAVDRVRRVIVEQGRSNQIFMEKVS